jgi:hypothetical protein
MASESEWWNQRRMRIEERGGHDGGGRASGLRVDELVFMVLPH